MYFIHYFTHENTVGIAQDGAPINETKQAWALWNDHIPAAPTVFELAAAIRQARYIADSMHPHVRTLNFPKRWYNNADQYGITVHDMHTDTTQTVWF